MYYILMGMSDYIRAKLKLRFVMTNQVNWSFVGY